VFDKAGGAGACWEAEFGRRPRNCGARARWSGESATGVYPRQRLVLGRGALPRRHRAPLLAGSVTLGECVMDGCYTARGAVCEQGTRAGCVPVPEEQGAALQ